MAFRDLFDPDKRSKDELRSEIMKRDEKIARLIVDIAELQSLDERNDHSKDLKASGEGIKPQKSDSGFAAEILSLKAAVAGLQISLRKSEDSEKKLRIQLEERDQKNETLARELEDERSRRQSEAIENREDHQGPLHARFEDTVQEAGLGGREAVERKVSGQVTRLEGSDESRVSSLITQLAAVEKELQELKRSTEAHELFSYRQQLSEARALAKKRADERDELGRSLAKERERSSISLAKLDEAHIEIKRLKAGTAEETWDLKRRAESAEKKLQGRDFELRNLNLRVADLEHTTKTFKAENDKLKNNSISLESHRKRCDQLERTAEFEKQQSRYYREQWERSHRDRVTAVNRVDRLTKELGSKKVKTASIALRSEPIFTNAVVMRWLVDEGDPGTAKVPNGWLGRVGEGPWSDALFAGTLEDVGYEFWSVPDSDLRHLIVGRKGWSKEELVSQIDAVDGEPLRIYSQEMFLAKVITGRDPFDSNDQDLLTAFAERHPALEFLLSLPLPWPTVCDGENRSIDPVDRDDYGVTETPLHLLGYHVGATSQLTDSQRRALLSECFKSHNLDFTDESSEIYRLKWGRGGSAQRLYRMAVHIKWLADGQGRDPRKPQARRDWINDLEWLRKTFHQQMKRRFEWP